MTDPVSAETPHSDETVGAAKTNSGLLTIRNMLLALTLVLVAMIVVMTGGSLQSAVSERNKAESAMALNELSDVITQLMLSVSGERTAVSTAYGFEGLPDTALVQNARNQRRTANITAEILDSSLDELTDFDNKTDLIAAFKKAWTTYADLQSDLDNDLTVAKDARSLRLRTVVRAQNTVIDAAAALRTAFELAFNTGNPRLEGIKQLKRQLWLMLEFSGRDSAAIGENIASGDPLSSIKLQVVSQYGGVVRASWTLVSSIASSELANSEIESKIQDIDDNFFGEFDILRDEVYTAAEFEEPYPVTAIEWVEKTAAASSPVNMMSAAADRLSVELNNEAVSAANSQMATSAGAMVIVLIIGAGAVFVVIFRVVRPVNAIAGTMHELADGNLESDVPYVENRDEVGDMARSVQVFKENAIERQRLEAEQREAERVALEEKAAREQAEIEEEKARVEEEEERRAANRAERRKVMLELADQFEASVSQVVEGVAQSAGNMESAARGLASTAKDTSGQADIVSNAAENASSNANMVASAAEELSSSVREITGQTNQSSAAARDAVGRTESASRDVSELVEAAQKIGEVVQLINDIAEQTNLLALNATIEAARAGDAGKGFAVVASEVKSLAAQTARATDEISGQVSGMQQATNTAVNAMDEIKGIISDIESTAVSIASAVEEQDASTQEIARNVAEVSAGTEEVTSNIQGVNQGAASTGSAANDVLNAAQLLTKQSDDLRGEVDQFLAQIRSWDQ